VGEGALLVVTLDTPGGLDTSMRDIVQTFLNAPVPIVVYVEPGQCRRRDPIRLAGCLVYLAAVDDVRHLRVIVDQGFARDRLIALVGHELQHAVEIARLPLRDSHGEEAGIESDATAVRDSVYETDEAVRAGRTILEELRRKANRRAPSAAGIPAGGHDP